MNQLKSIDLIGKTGTQGFVARLLELACLWGIGVVPCGPAVGSLRTVAGLSAGPPPACREGAAVRSAAPKRTGDGRRSPNRADETAGLSVGRVMMIVRTRCRRAPGQAEYPSLRDTRQTA